MIAPLVSSLDVYGMLASADMSDCCLSQHKCTSSDALGRSMF